MSKSLNVVNIAFTFCASLRRAAIRCRILFILTRCSVLVPLISDVGSAGGSLTVAASIAWAWRIAATGMVEAGAAGGGGAGFGGVGGEGAAADGGGGGGGGGSGGAAAEDGGGGGGGVGSATCTFGFGAAAVAPPPAPVQQIIFNMVYSTLDIYTNPTENTQMYFIFIFPALLF